MKHLRYPLPAQLRGERLRLELVAAVGGPVDVSVTQDDPAKPLEVTVPDNAVDATVAATVAAHDGSPTTEETQANTARAADINTLQAYLGAATPTAAQSAAALKALIRVVRALA